MASPKELTAFLKDVEKRAFKRALYHVRNNESALDIVQDSMMRLAESYGDRPVEELPMLFQRILSNATLDWFRRQKVQNAHFLSVSDFESDGEDSDSDFFENLPTAETAVAFENPETKIQRIETLQLIEAALLQLPGRQREAFLLRYWEDMDVAETANTMKCSQGSVKVHCSRAIHSLLKSLSPKGIRL